MSRPPLKWRRLAVPKRGHRLEEYEDAAAGDGGRGRFAVADGATESAFAGDWSRLLAEAFVLEPVSARGWPEWLPAVRQRWVEAVGGRELPWYLEEKFAQGAFATLMGLELTPAAQGGGWDWRAVAVGDCCLFQVRRQEMVCSFPLDDSAEFNTTPDLIGSRPGPPPRDQRAKGQGKPGDAFLLLSDALAQWALRRQEASRPPWIELMALTEPTFPAWIEALWAAKELKNDDATILVVELPAAEARA